MTGTLFATSCRKLSAQFVHYINDYHEERGPEQGHNTECESLRNICEPQSSLRRINGLRQSKETKAQEGDNTSGHNPMILIPLRSCNFLILTTLTTRRVGTLTTLDGTTWPSPKTTISADGLPMPC